MVTTHRRGVSLPIALMTSSEYDGLPDYSVSYPKEILIGCVWKLSKLAAPGKLLISQKTGENTEQTMYCEIIEE